MFLQLILIKLTGSPTWIQEEASLLCHWCPLLVNRCFLVSPGKVHTAIWHFQTEIGLWFSMFTWNLRLWEWKILSYCAKRRLSSFAPTVTFAVSSLKTSYGTIHKANIDSWFYWCMRECHLHHPNRVWEWGDDGPDWSKPGKVESFLKLDRVCILPAFSFWSCKVRHMKKISGSKSLAGRRSLCCRGSSIQEQAGKLLLLCFRIAECRDGKERLVPMVLYDTDSSVMPTGWLATSVTTQRVANCEGTNCPEKQSCNFPFVFTSTSLYILQQVYLKTILLKLIQHITSSLKLPFIKYELNF